MRLPTLLFYFFLLLTVACVAFADNTLTIDQIGSNNTFTIDQTGNGHSATITAGKISDVDYTTFAITQQGTGAKTANLEVKSGSNNSITVNQDGAGNHTASIQSFVGSGNNISLNQTGAGKHEFNIINNTGTTNSGNTVTATQSGGAGSDKWFNIWFSGATGATVNVVQDNATAADQASMNVQCLSGTCGNYSYIKH